MCLCRSARSGRADIRTRTISPLTKDKREIARRPDKAPMATAWDYAPAPEARDIVKIQERYGLFIGGGFIQPASGERHTTIDPARAEPPSEVAPAAQAHVDPAVCAARAAFA